MKQATWRFRSARQAAVVAVVSCLGLILPGCRPAEGGGASPTTAPATTASATTAPAGSTLPVVPMRIGTKTYQLEVASDYDSREHGLMQRASMPADHGMIFVFTDAQVLHFWMKNTWIPLDILFLDSDGKVVSEHTMKPFDEHTTSSDAPARYAIELNAGQISADGAQVGDKLSVPASVNADVKN